MPDLRREVSAGPWHGQHRKRQHTPQNYELIARSASDWAIHATTLADDDEHRLRRQRGRIKEEAGTPASEEEGANRREHLRATKSQVVDHVQSKEGQHNSIPDSGGVGEQDDDGGEIGHEAQLCHADDTLEVLVVAAQPVPGDTSAKEAAVMREVMTQRWQMEQW